MFGKFNETVIRALQNDGYVPAGFDCLWIGDDFVWEVGFGLERKMKYLKIIDLQAKDASYWDDGGRRYGEAGHDPVFVENTICRIVAIDEDGYYHHLTISTGHTTWIRQCEKNKQELFDIAQQYQDALKS